MTLYGPGIAFGAPSSGSVVLTRSFPPPRPWANETHAVSTNAAVSADFMRRSLADVNTTERAVRGRQTHAGDRRLVHLNNACEAFRHFGDGDRPSRRRSRPRLMST